MARPGVLPRCLLWAAALPLACAFLPFSNPPWPPTYNLSLSTITMACNQSGYFDAHLASRFGIPSFDWSNDKKDWALARPMDCEERLVAQAAATRAANPASRPFTYRNLVKALPWFSTVRAKLVDPQFEGFFLRFKPGGAFPNGSYHVPRCDTNYDPPLCSDLYHDQEQTPAVPSPANPNPDGACAGTCDCGGVPCGEYLFDHRNGTMLRTWLLDEVIGGPNGVDGVTTHGLFVDDFWCSNLLNGTGRCTDPVQGPTEIDRNSQADMGLSDADIRDLTVGWLETQTAAQATVLARGGYTWSLIPGQDNANASPLMLTPGNCAATVRRACAPTSPWLTAPLLLGLTPGTPAAPLPRLAAELAAFQLMRGPYAYVGYGVWGMSWPAGSSWDNRNSTLPIPPELGVDYGVPMGQCVEGPTGVFSRAWTKRNVTLDCSALA